MCRWGEQPWGEGQGGACVTQLSARPTKPPPAGWPLGAGTSRMPALPEDWFWWALWPPAVWRGPCVGGFLVSASTWRFWNFVLLGCAQ